MNARSASTPVSRERPLFERLGARDVDALGELYDCYGALVYALLLRMVADRSEAEGLLQTVFKSAWEHPATYDSREGSPAVWLLRMARAFALDRNRDRTRAATLAPWSGPGGQPQDKARVMSAFAREQRDAVRAVGMLPCEQRELIEEAYFLGLTQSELAARHQLPIDIVKARIRTGLLSLRQHLSQTSIDQ